MKKNGINSNGALRITIVAIAVLLQLILLGLMVVRLRQYSVYIYILLEIVGLLEVISIVSRKRNTAYTVAWIIIILSSPVFGHLIYILWGRSGTHSRKSRIIQNIFSKGHTWLKHFENNYLDLDKDWPSLKKISKYLKKEGFPLYKNTKCKYFSLGEYHFESMIEDLKNAKKFIFLEYFILSSGQLWDEIHDILKEKAAQGVEVRLLYDDFGSLLTLPKNFIKVLESEEIKVLKFNPVHRQLERLYINYRNHQKITVIDGNIGYTGGTNLADEYANIYPKYGHWKDTAIRLEGEAVWSLTVTFLQMWESESNTTEDYFKFKPTVEIEGEGYFQPFNDNPVNQPHNPAEATYRMVVNSASKYVYIATPYLVIDDNMMDALCIAALSGVDVRIITPKVWDKWYVHMVTRSNYGKLLEHGVKIYEYTPGYIHAKTIISDDIHAITGSINMDYRSFYLHFENGVYICDSPVLKDIKNDIEDVFKVSEKITLEQWKNRSLRTKFIQMFLRLFIPLL